MFPSGTSLTGSSKSSTWWIVFAMLIACYALLLAVSLTRAISQSNAVEGFTCHQLVKQLFQGQQQDLTPKMPHTYRVRQRPPRLTPLLRCRVRVHQHPEHPDMDVRDHKRLRPLVRGRVLGGLDPVVPLLNRPPVVVHIIRRPARVISVVHKRPHMPLCQQLRDVVEHSPRVVFVPACRDPPWLPVRD